MLTDLGFERLRVQGSHKIFGHPEEAVAEVVAARDAWIEAARSTGRPVPVPRYRPAICAS